MNTISKIREFIKNTTNLNDKIFFYVSIISSLLTLLTTIITIAEQSDIISCISVFITFIIVTLIGYISIRYNKMRMGRIVFCYVLGCILLPFIYLSCGGIDSGSPIYMLTSFFIIGILLEGKSGILCLLINLIVDFVILWLPYYHVQVLINAKPLSLYGRYLDNSIAVILTGITLFILSLMSLTAYRNEHERSELLLTQLQDKSIKDELSGLYNRRHLYDELNTIYKKDPDEIKNYYIAMYDLDNFKTINDSYGHLFGDKVIVYFSDLLKKNVKEDDGELASRFGGEEFICLYKASNFEKAFSKAETIRLNFMSLDWKNAPNLTTTVSIGLVGCRKFTNMNECLKNVDDLLYIAKENGKNKISYSK